MTYLGKIEGVIVGRGGYQDVMFGVNFILSGEKFSVQDFKGTWGSCMSKDKDTDWHEGQLKVYGETLLFLDRICDEAKVTNIVALVGKPIEVTFTNPNGRLVSWRILKEVL